MSVLSGDFSNTYREGSAEETDGCSRYLREGMYFLWRLVHEISIDRIVMILGGRSSRWNRQ